MTTSDYKQKFKLTYVTHLPTLKDYIKRSATPKGTNLNRQLIRTPRDSEIGLPYLEAQTNLTLKEERTNLILKEGQPKLPPKDAQELVPPLTAQPKLSSIDTQILAYLKALIASGPHQLLLRAKELSTKDYETLLLALWPAAKKAKVKLIISHHAALGVQYGIPVQLSVNELKALSKQATSTKTLASHSNQVPESHFAKAPASHFVKAPEPHFDQVFASRLTTAPAPLLPVPYGVSVHSLTEAQYAKAHHAQWLVFGHVFPSRCKPNLPPRDWKELEAIMALQIPTFAIGGIHQDNFHLLPPGLAGICMMNETMEQSQVNTYTATWKKLIQTI